MARRIRWTLETPLQGASWTEVIEVDDDATNEEIDDAVREEVSNIASWGWTEIGQDGEPIP